MQYWVEPTSCFGRVVKALDLKSNGVSPRRFKSCRQRSFFCFLIYLQMVDGQISRVMDHNLWIKVAAFKWKIFKWTDIDGQQFKLDDPWWYYDLGGRSWIKKMEPSFHTVNLIYDRLHWEINFQNGWFDHPFSILLVISLKDLALAC